VARVEATCQYRIDGTTTPSGSGGNPSYRTVGVAGPPLPGYVRPDLRPKEWAGGVTEVPRILGAYLYRQLVTSAPAGAVASIRFKIWSTYIWWYRRRLMALGRVWSPFQQCSDPHS